MSQTQNLRDRRLPLRDAAGIPALGFGTLIPDTAETRSATGIALEAGFRHFDCSERYRNEEQVGEAIQARYSGRLDESKRLVHHDENYGTTTIGRSGSSLRSSPVVRSCNSSWSTSTSCTLHMRFIRETIRTRETKTTM